MFDDDDLRITKKMTEKKRIIELIIDVSSSQIA